MEITEPITEPNQKFEEKDAHIYLGNGYDELLKLIGLKSDKIVLSLFDEQVGSSQHAQVHSHIIPVLHTFQCSILEVDFISPSYFAASTDINICDYFKNTTIPGIVFEYGSLADIEHSQVISIFNAIAENPNIDMLSSYDSQNEYTGLPFNNHIRNLNIPPQYILTIEIDSIQNAKLEYLVLDCNLYDDVVMAYMLGENIIMDHMKIGYLSQLYEICKKCRYLTSITFNKQHIEDILVHRSQHNLHNSILSMLEDNKKSSDKAKNKYLQAIVAVGDVYIPGDINRITSHKNLLMIIQIKLYHTKNDYCWFEGDSPSPPSPIQSNK